MTGRSASSAAARSRGAAASPRGGRDQLARRGGPERDEDVLGGGADVVVGLAERARDPAEVVGLDGAGPRAAHRTAATPTAISAASSPEPGALDGGARTRDTSAVSGAGLLAPRSHPLARELQEVTAQERELAALEPLGPRDHAGECRERRGPARRVAAAAAHRALEVARGVEHVVVGARREVTTRARSRSSSIAGPDGA